MPKLGDIVRGKEINHKPKYRKHIWIACSICGKERWVGLLKGKPMNIRCNSCAKKGKNNPRWKSGKHAGKGGYVLVEIKPTSPFFAMRDKQSYIKEHRLVMAKHLGRCLKSWEIVHHKNDIKNDNKLENLELMTASEHNGLTQRRRVKNKEK